MQLYFLALHLHLQVPVQLSLVILLVIPLVPVKDLLLFPGQWSDLTEQNPISEATFKKLVSPNYALNVTVLVTSQTVFCLFCQMPKNWHASMSGDRTALWGRQGEHAHLFATWECRCLRKHRGGEWAKSGSVTKQYLFPHGAGLQEECLQGLLAPQPLSDQMGAFFTHANLQGLAEVLTLWPEMG